MSLFPDDSAERKTYPVYSGLMAYFPSALAAVARHSYLGNQKHNAGLPLHHDRAKSDDEADALMRHLMEGDYTGVAWRALALLQKHLEAQGAPIAPGARNARPPARVALEGALQALGQVPQEAGAVLAELLNRSEADDPPPHDGRLIGEPRVDTGD
jgi:hypothetical protein